MPLFVLVSLGALVVFNGVGERLEGRRSGLSVAREGVVEVEREGAGHTGEVAESGLRAGAEVLADSFAVEPTGDAKDDLPGGIREL